jgi:glycosyltransferase involved in cell wall biosynthesis
MWWFLSRPFRKINWRLETVYDELLQGDFGIIPVEPETAVGPGLSVPWWMVSSENRLTLMMSLGLPVIASPVPAYEPIIESGRNGFVARTPEDWANMISQLRDPSIREAIGRAARAAVVHQYSMEEQARKLIASLDSL